MGYKVFPRTSRLFRPLNESLPADGNKTNVVLNNGRTWNGVRTGDNNPKWREVIRDGGDATNAMTFETLYRDFIGFDRPVVLQGTFGPDAYGITNRNVISKNSSYGLSDTYATDVPWWYKSNEFVTLSAAAKNQAAIGIRKKIFNEQNLLLGGVFVREFGQTVDLLMHPAKAGRELLSRFIGRASSIRRSSLSSKTKRNLLSKQWLEFSFGMQPLMSDIGAISEALYKMERDRVKRFAFTAQAEKSTDTSFLSPLMGLAYNAKIRRTERYSVSFRYVAGVRVRSSGHTPGSAGNLMEYSGFNLSSVVPTIWEAIPWSFLIDYFVNVGDVLTANRVIDSDIVWSKSSVWKTFEDSQKVTGLDILSNGVSRVESYGLPNSKGVYLRIERSKESVAIPRLSFSLPGRNVQFLNMAALLGARKS